MLAQFPAARNERHVRALLAALNLSDPEEPTYAWDPSLDPLLLSLAATRAVRRLACRLAPWGIRAAGSPQAPALSWPAPPNPAAAEILALCIDRYVQDTLCAEKLISCPTPRAAKMCAQFTDSAQNALDSALETLALLA